MSRWERFYSNIQQDCKLFVFVLVILCGFRIGFIAILNQYVSDTTALNDILLSNYYGLRISLKSAGIIAFISFLFCTIANIAIAHMNFTKIRFYLGSAYIFLLTLLFHIRIPYYETFRVAFSQFIFNTLKDDTTALFSTMVTEYNLPMRMLSVIVVTYLLSKLLQKLLQTKTYPLPKLIRWKSFAFRTGLLAAMIVVMIFIRFGGSLSYARSIHWANAAITKDDFLNEAILDDVQAVYRAYSTHKSLAKATNLDIRKEAIYDYGAFIAGRTVNTNNIEEFFKKEAQGAKIPKPDHIFLIIGESYAEWPLLEKYRELNIANGMKKIINQRDAAHIQTFLPNGSGTMAGVSGIVTGLPEVNLYPNYQLESYKEPYATAIAMQMKKLGYKTYFWYSGFSSWQRIKDFALSQGFDKFYSCSDFSYQSGNAWGSEDKYFLSAVEAMFRGEQSTFHVILTGSNHPPYTVNLQQEGFDRSAVLAGLPDTVKNDTELVTKLGHFWYADKVLANFIETMQHKYPKSLFVITGDHADRVNIDTHPSMFERYAIPFVVRGQGIHKELFARDVPGSHIDIAPTLIELVAPEGFTYYSMGANLTNGNDFSANQLLWTNANYIGRINSDTIESLPWNEANAARPEIHKIQQKIDALRALAWWRIKYGKYID